MKIDAHQHFWKYDPAEYRWISEEDVVLKRDFLPTDLDPLLRENGIDGCIAVQARQTIEETRWLLELAASHSKVKGVVGWVPLCEPNVAESLDRFSQSPFLVGLRHVVQDEPDDHFILREDFNQGVNELASRNLVYDILIFAKHLPQTIEFVDRHPELSFVLDHIAKPRIQAHSFDTQWQKGMLELGKRENVACKLSGMVTEVVGDHWEASLFIPYFETVLEAFGPARLMAGSDWPVCLLRSEYSRWHQTIRSLIRPLSASEQSAILGENATRVYQLSP